MIGSGHCYRSNGVSAGLRSKRDLYAQHGIVEYWVVDVNQSRIIVHLDLVQGNYGRTREYLAGETVAPRAFPHMALGISELFA